MSNLAQYVFHKCKTRRGTHWNRYGPFYLCAVAVPLVVADILRHVLVDNGMWTPADRISPAMYRPGCNQPIAKCLSPIGFVFTIVFTYTGYILLITGNLWAANLHTKLRDAWRKLRRG
eukprot:TRINITY_DN1481_c0_g1_i1.p2 TRINITY_DN1481_c0_g1~~TRINITY_DN1481_c0_g1_i1.p2  ORF type:complete len:118 (-),score=0.88 TRINITY_DN1481_c0_g1_i1:156-509(-)